MLTTITAWRPVTYNSNPMWYHQWTVIGPEANVSFTIMLWLTEGEYTVKFNYCVYREYANLRFYYGTEKIPIKCK